MRRALSGSSISRSYLVLPVLLAALIGGGGLAHGLERPSSDSLAEVRSQDREALETLASASDTLRQAALEASAHPRLLNRVHNLQRRSSNAFRDLVGDLPREEQEKVWELLRYPDLIALIVDGGRKDEVALRSLVSAYDGDIRDIAVDLGLRQPLLLRRIYALEAQSERDFERELEGSGDTTRDAFRKLVSAPEVLDLLTDHMHMSVTLGGAYLDNPERVQADLSLLHDQGVARRDHAEKNWRSEIEEDAEAREELAEAQREYEETFGGGDGEDHDERNTAAVYLLTYPYWFGYPTWHVNLYSGYPSYYYWRPHHLHHQLHHGYGHHPSFGVSYHSGHVGFSFGFPSFHFSHWYFAEPAHHDRYSHLSHRMLRHQERHPRLHHGGYRVANRWKHEQRGRGTHDWLRDDGRRSERLRHYGQVERNDREARARDPFRHRTPRRPARRVSYHESRDSSRGFAQPGSKGRGFRVASREPAQKHKTHRSRWGSRRDVKVSTSVHSKANKKTHPRASKRFHSKVKRSSHSKATPKAKRRGKGQRSRSSSKSLGHPRRHGRR